MLFASSCIALCITPLKHQHWYQCYCNPCPCVCPPDACACAYVPVFALMCPHTVVFNPVCESLYLYCRTYIPIVGQYFSRSCFCACVTATVSVPVCLHEYVVSVCVCVCVCVCSCVFHCRHWEGKVAESIKAEQGKATQAEKQWQGRLVEVQGDWQAKLAEGQAQWAQDRAAAEQGWREAKGHAEQQWKQQLDSIQHAHRLVCVAVCNLQPASHGLGVHTHCYSC